MENFTRVKIRPGGIMNILNLRLCFIPLGMALALPAMDAAAPAQTDIRRDAVVQAVEKVMPCVVNVATESVIESRDPFEELMRKFYGSRHSALGSGVIISDDGYLLTNLHVVNHATRIQVKLSDAAGGGVYDVQHIYVVNPKQDVALLKIVPKKNGQKFKAVQFAKNDDLLLGETVLALGNPFGLGESVSRGILSSKSRAPARENEDLSMENWLQTDALINPGNSGGPLINLRGELIGINVAILQGAQGIGFAIPIKEVREALGEMFNPETASRWFGARVGVDSPLVVQSVESNSPAGQAGLETGDCNLQMGAFDAATNAYVRVLNSPFAGLSVRCQAQIRIGVVLEKMAAQAVGTNQTALLQSALGNYLDVLDTSFGNNLRPGETADAFWAKKAGLQALPLIETLGAANPTNYIDQMEMLFPQAKNSLEKIRATLPPPKS